MCPKFQPVKIVEKSPGAQEARISREHGHFQGQFPYPMAIWAWIFRLRLWPSKKRIPKILETTTCFAVQKWYIYIYIHIHMSMCMCVNIYIYTVCICVIPKMIDSTGCTMLHPCWRICTPMSNSVPQSFGETRIPNHTSVIHRHFPFIPLVTPPLQSNELTEPMNNCSDTAMNHYSPHEIAFVFIFGGQTDWSIVLTKTRIMI